MAFFMPLVKGATLKTVSKGVENPMFFLLQPAERYCQEIGTVKKYAQISLQTLAE